MPSDATKPPPQSVRARRLALGLTLEELARVAGVDPHLLDLVELQLRNPGRSWLAHLARVLDNLTEGTPMTNQPPSGWAMNRGDRVWHFYTGHGATACGRPDNQRPTLGRVNAPDCASCADATWPASEMRGQRPSRGMGISER